MFTTVLALSLLVKLSFAITMFFYQLYVFVCLNLGLNLVLSFRLKQRWLRLQRTLSPAKTKDSIFLFQAYYPATC